MQRGACFSNAFAAGNWTPFSFPSILGTNPVFVEKGDLGPGEKTLATHLSDAGVQTAGFNAANGFLTEYWGYDRGFDSFETWVDAGRWLAAHPTVQGWLQYAIWPVRRIADQMRGEDRHAADTSYLRAVEERVVEFLTARSSENRPFFVWTHLMDTHTPYVPGPRYVREITDRRSGAVATLKAHAKAGLGRTTEETTVTALRNLYDAAAKQIDDALERLLERLAALGLAEDTLVVVAGDHGEEFLDHGHLAHYPKLYHELVHVPLILYDPRAKARTIDVPVSLGSIPTTIADTFGVDTEPFESPSLTPAVLDGATPTCTEPVVSVAVRGDSITQQPIPRTLDDGDLLLAARDKRWTLIRNTGSGEQELYDRRADPGETDNMIFDTDHDGVVNRLEATIDERQARIGSAGANQPIDEGPSPTLAAQLQALGYK